MFSSRESLNQIYQILLQHFDRQHWWPADGPFEVCVGAILTQNTSWTNVEKAISNLKQAGVLSYRELIQVLDQDLARMIQPAGYFNVKTKRLRNFLNFIRDEFDDFDRLFSLSHSELREKLLSISGIGPETADSMVLYAFGKPSFVVDAYTKRILVRHSLIDEEADYYQIQEFFENNLVDDPQLFNEYHALLVRIGKNYCKKSKPNCRACPLREIGELRTDL